MKTLSPHQIRFTAINILVIFLGWGTFTLWLNNSHRKSLSTLKQAEILGTKLSQKSDLILSSFIMDDKEIYDLALADYLVINNEVTAIQNDLSSIWLMNSNILIDALEENKDMATMLSIDQSYHFHMQFAEGNAFFANMAYNDLNKTESMALHETLPLLMVTFLSLFVLVQNLYGKNVLQIMEEFLHSSFKHHTKTSEEQINS